MKLSIVIAMVLVAAVMGSLIVLAPSNGSFGFRAFILCAAIGLMLLSDAEPA